MRTAVSVYNPGFEYSRMQHLHITPALMLYGMGISVANIQITPAHPDVKAWWTP